MEDELKHAGLTKNEARVYLALLKLGTTTTKAIIERTALHRQVVYDALEFLIEKGLVSFVVEANRKHFKASEPKQFLNYFEKKQQEIEKQKQEFSKILKDIESLKEKHEETQEATIFRGNKGIKSLMDDMLESKEILTIGASDIGAEAFKYHMQFNLPRFHILRAKKKINCKILLSEEMKARAMQLDKMSHTEARVLPKEFTSNSSINIYGNKISIIMWGSQPFGVLIRSREIAEAQRKHFEILWKIGKRP